LGLSIGHLPVQPLVSKVGEVYDVAGCEIVTPTILVYTGARVVVRRRHVDGPLRRGTAYDHGASVWPLLGPIEMVASKLDLSKANRLGKDIVCCNRGLPRAIRCDLRCHCYLLPLTYDWAASI
jgi:hypothetical protein